jgi:hypothetical protein
MTRSEGARRRLSSHPASQSEWDGARGHHATATALVALVAGLGGAIAQPGCARSPSKPGGLELVITTNVDVPLYFDTFRLEVFQQTDAGVHLWVSNDFPVPSAEATLPTTFLISAGSTPNEVAFIRVTAFHETTPLSTGVPEEQEVILRELRASVPTDRIALLPVVLSAACYGRPYVGPSDPSCPPGQSCLPWTGACGDETVDVGTLPTYVPGAEDTVDAGPHEAPVVDAGADAPACAAPNLTVVYHPPTGPTGACTSSEIAAFYSSCITSGVCASGTGDGGSGVSAACTSCLVAPVGSDAWGALLPGPAWQLNLGGCYVAEAQRSMGGGGELACGQAFEALLECERQTCSGADGGASAYETCRAAADIDPSTCACFQRNAALTCAALSSSPCNASAAALFEARYQAIAQEICGP